jgi:hypothetical protein
MRNVFFYVFIVTWLLPSFCFSQVNLVLNPSFEDTVSTFSGFSTIGNQILNWWSVQLSPDYFSEVYSFATPAPNTVVGYQLPRTGSAFVGEFFYSAGDKHYEYIGGTLAKPLEADKVYCAQFFVNLASKGDLTTYLPADGFDMYITSDSIANSLAEGGLLLFNAQVSNPPGNIIYDTVNWIPVTGQFAANGGEKYFIIGNFRSIENTQVYDPLGYGGPNYYLIDDVSLWLCYPDTANSPGHYNFDNALSTSIASQRDTIPQIFGPPLIIPNLLSSYETSFWQFINLHEGISLSLYNGLGQLIFSSVNYNNDMPASLLAPGMYFYLVTQADDAVHKGKLMVIR